MPISWIKHSIEGVRIYRFLCKIEIKSTNFERQEDKVFQSNKSRECKNPHVAKNVEDFKFWFLNIKTTNRNDFSLGTGTVKNSIVEKFEINVENSSSDFYSSPIIAQKNKYFKVL